MISAPCSFTELVMRTRRLCPWVHIALVILVSAPATLVRAQFQQPTDEELKMTSDPKAQGAAAVYLNVEETHRRFTCTIHSFYARIKVLTGKRLGVGHSRAPIPEHGPFQITDIKARTIHA
jgi:hypothetical protein